MKQFGPRRWLSVQILAWGLVATFQSFISNYASYLATRLLLGLLEAGFIPGMTSSMQSAVPFEASSCSRLDLTFQRILVLSFHMV